MSLLMSDSERQLESKLEEVSGTCSKVATIEEIKILVEKLKYNHYFFSAICPQDIWLSDKYDASLLNLDGYNLISQGKKVLLYT